MCVCVCVCVCVCERAEREKGAEEERAIMGKRGTVTGVSREEKERCIVHVLKKLFC